MHILKYNRYPNNEVRVTHYYKANPPLVSTGDFLCEPDPSLPGTASHPEGVSAESTPPSLDISSDFPHPQPEKQRMKTKFGQRAKNTILRMGGALDTIDSTPQNYVFLTGTIPGGTHAAFLAVAEQSPYITSSIADWLRRTAPTEHWFYVWELQRRGALHIHYCLHCPHPDTRNRVITGWRSKWEAIIQEVGKKAATDMWERKDGTHHKDGHSVLQAYAQEVHKSVAAYMAGYCSGIKDKHSLDANSPYYPSRWWGASRKLTNLLKGLTEEVVVEHNDYRSARYQIQLHYERALHDSPKAHHYPHKVGIGSTCVSYHPEDKGLTLWNTLQPMIFKPQSHPNTCCMIAGLLSWVKIYLPYLRALKKQKDSSLPLLLRDLEELVYLGSLSRYTVSSAQLRVIALIPSVLSFNAMENRIPEKMRCMCIAACWSYHQNHAYLRFNQQGWLSLENDLPIRLTDCPSLRDIGTNHPKGWEAVPSEGIGGNSSSPSDSSPEQLCLF